MTTPPSKTKIKLSKAEKKSIKESANHSCVMCGVAETQWLKLQVHHIQPRYLGGTNATSNLMPVCPNCHCKLHSNI